MANEPTYERWDDLALDIDCLEWRLVKKISVANELLLDEKLDRLIRAYTNAPDSLASARSFEAIIKYYHDLLDE